MQASDDAGGSDAALRDMMVAARVEDAPRAVGVIRYVPEDFQVEEVLAFEPHGEGVHGYLWIEKRDINTEQLARRVAGCAGVRAMDVGYAGLKDRRAVARQWFSVNLSGRDEPDWKRLESERIRILRVTRHGHKLKRGALRGNRFRIAVRELSVGLRQIAPTLERIQHQGVPNYFGEQRFGRAGSNVARAAEVLTGRQRAPSRHERGLYLSAARSLLFNRVLSVRVAEGSWNRALDGDVMVLDGRHGLFTAGPVDADTNARLAGLAIHPTGPLWGVGGIRTCRVARAVEERALAPLAEWCRGLEAAGLALDRRALRLRVAELRWRMLESRVLEVSFTLTKGGYATAVLREVISWRTGDPAGAA